MTINSMNMEYNTQMKRLPLPEYGRGIQNMVDHALTIEDNAERQRCANTIINIMGNMFPHLRDVPDFKHKLWDHLAIMADFKLNIKAPYEVIEKTKLFTKPEPLNYPNNKIRYRHYGYTVEQLIKKAAEYPDGEEKQALLSLIANQMKKSFLLWNKDTVEDQKIIDDLVGFSDGNIRIEEGSITLSEIKSSVSVKIRPTNNTNNNNRNNKNNNNRRYFKK